jgi:hypothetical protein
MRRTRDPGPPLADPRPPDSGYGCGSAAVGVLVVLFIVSVALTFYGWTP